MKTIATLGFCMILFLSQIAIAQKGYDVIFEYGKIHSEWAMVEKDGLLGFIDEDGYEIVPPIYNGISPFDEFRNGWAMVEKDGLLGFIDEDGEEIVKPKYTKIFPFGEDHAEWAMVEINGKFGFIDQYGDERISITENAETNETIIEITPENENDIDTITIEDNNNDTTRIRIGKRNVIIVGDDDGDEDITIIDENDSKFESRWEGLDIGLNNFSTSKETLSFPSSQHSLNLKPEQSFAVHINMNDVELGLFQDKIGIVTGFGLDFDNYRFRKDIRLKNTDTNMVIVPDSIHFTKAKLTTVYLTVPLLLEWQIPTKNDKNRIVVVGGLVGGLRLGTHTKHKYELNGNKYKDKVRDDFHVSPFTYYATARLGLKDFQIFVNYHLQSLFIKNEGPELYPVTFGISFGG